METTFDKTKLQQGGVIEQLRRKLLPIDEYAARQGISVKTVENFGRMGIIQMRKYKGKTFVVEIPYTSSRTVDLAPRGRGKVGLAKKISRLAQKLIFKHPKDKQESLWRSESQDEIVEVQDTGARDLSEIEIVEEPESDGEYQIQDVNLFGPIEAPDFEIFATSDKFDEVVEGIEQELAEEKAEEQTEEQAEAETEEQTQEQVEEETEEQTEAETQEQPEEEIKATSREGLGYPQVVYLPETRSKRIWQVVATVSGAFFLAAVFAGFQFYSNMEIAVEALDNVQRSRYASPGQGVQQANVVGKELERSQAELERLQNELAKTRVEAARAKGTLATEKENFETSRQMSIEAIQQLEREIQELTVRFEELTSRQ